MQELQNEAVAAQAEDPVAHQLQSRSLPAVWTVTVWVSPAKAWPVISGNFGTYAAAMSNS